MKRCKNNNNMNKRTTVLTTAIGVIAFILLFSLCSYIEHTYTIEATTWIEEDGTVTFIDEIGHEWQADAEGVTHKQKVILVMGDLCSPSVKEDDVIKKIKPIKIRMN